MTNHATAASPHRGMELTDYIQELTQPHTHTEPITSRINGVWHTVPHTTRVPALIHQLDYATPSGKGEEDRAGSAFESRPAAALEALDTLVRIDLAAARWIRDMGEDDPGDTVACLRKLHGLTQSAHPVTRREVERDARRWWTQARVVTGWDSPAWRPDNTCPMCDERGTLRVRLAEQIGFCTDCHETWDHASIGLLADHIRAETEAERKPRTGQGPCWCPWPKPTIPDLRVLCPGCGSARCWHAVSARMVQDTRTAVTRGA